MVSCREFGGCGEAGAGGEGCCAAVEQALASTIIAPIAAATRMVRCSTERSGAPARRVRSSGLTKPVLADSLCVSCALTVNEFSPLGDLRHRVLGSGEPASGSFLVVLRKLMYPTAAVGRPCFSSVEGKRPVRETRAPGSLVGNDTAPEHRGGLTPTMRSVETVLFLVVLATVVASFARRLRLPAPSLLVVAGVIVGLLPGVPTIAVTPEIVSLVVLPPLLFAAGEELPWRDLRAVWRPVTVLAVGLVLVSAAAVGFVAVALTPLPVGMAFVLGAVLASTDPVAVTALGRRLALPPRVQALVQAESLFNDATSLLLFRVAVLVAVVGGSVSWAGTFTTFVVLAGGGVLVGVMVAAGAFLIRRRTEDPVLETVVCLVTPYVAYVAAEAITASGVTAVVVASVLLGTQASRLTTARIRIQLSAVFQTVVFLLESVVFGLIGLQLPALVRRMSDSQAAWPLQAVAIAATLMIVRVMWVFPLSAITSRRRQRRVSWQVPAVVSWAGARGVVPLAAALSIPLTLADGSLLPHRDLVLLLTTAVIVITLVVQGFTLAPLVRRSGIALTQRHVSQENIDARTQVAQAALVYLDDIEESESAPQFAIEQLRHSWKLRLDRIQAESNEDPLSPSTMAEYRQLRHDLLAVETAELNRLHRAGEITDSTRRRVQRILDLDQAGLQDQDP